MASQPGRARLTGANALSSDVDQPWEQDNQAWWDWYVSLGSDGIDNPVASGPEAVELADAVLVSELSDDQIASDAELDRDLAIPYNLTPQQGDSFRRNGFIKLPEVFSPRVVRRLRLEMIRAFKREFSLDPDRDAAERFLSIEMAWLKNPVMRQFVLSPRVARLSAELLDVKAVRLYHDNLLAKQPGGGRTPWHNDRHHFPLATDDVVTAWIPAQPIPGAMGPLAFAGPIDAYELVADIEFDKFGTTFDERVERAFRDHAPDVWIEQQPFALGEVSFHHNLCFHSAGANRTRYSRMALANTYFVSGARVIDKPTMVSGDWQKFMPGVAPGEVVDSKFNPVCWSADEINNQTRNRAGEIPLA